MRGMSYSMYVYLCVCMCVLFMGKLKGKDMGRCCHESQIQESDPTSEYIKRGRVENSV
ncbi:hypothetical protein V6Z12_A05G299800 [Gossypium hirsutum]